MLEILFLFGEYWYFCSEKRKGKSMTTFALNNLWTYLQGLMLSQSEREWLVGKLSESVEKVSSEAKEDTTAKTYEEIPVSPEIKKWIGCISFTEEEIENDPRLKAILS